MHAQIGGETHTHVHHPTEEQSLHLLKVECVVCCTASTSEGEGAGEEQGTDGGGEGGRGGGEEERGG